MTFAKVGDFADLLRFPVDGGDPVGPFMLEKREWNNCLDIELIEDVNLSPYTNADLETQEVAIFMKRKLP